MEKHIKKVIPKVLEKNPLGFISVDMFHTEYGFEPFLVFTEFHMDKAIFGPHPHAGISVMTYMLPDSKGSFINRDSLGDYSIIEPGGMHVTQAGSGVKHDEVPAENGVNCHGFQIWINHADKDRLAEPRAFHAFAKDIAVYEDDKLQLRVLQGSYMDVRAPFDLLTKTSLFDVTLVPHATVELDAKAMAFIYLLSGSATIGGNEVNGLAMVTFDPDGDTITVTAGTEPAHFIFASGTPHNEPIVTGGPFVMTTQEQMAATHQRYQQGKMGVLHPL